MEKIEIPEDQIAPMDAVANHIHGLRIIFVNVFAVSSADHSWILIDAGLPFSEGAIAAGRKSNSQGLPKPSFSPTDISIMSALSRPNCRGRLPTSPPIGIWLANPFAGWRNFGRPCLLQVMGSLWLVSM